MPQALGILAPAGRDAAVIADILGKAGIAHGICDSIEDLIGALSGRAGAAIISEEALGTGELDLLTDWLNDQPPWSDLPILLLTRRNGNLKHQSKLAEHLGNVTILERPLHPVTLVSASRSALRARARQRQAEAHIVQLDESARRLTSERQLLREREEQLSEANEKLGQRFAEALAEKRVLADIVERSQAFVQVADLNYRWLAINHAAKAEFHRIFGVQPEVGKSMLDLLDHMPEHRKAVQAVWGRALAGEEFTEVGQFGDPDRDQRYYEMNFNTLYDENGERIGAYQFVYDVTERVENQKQLADAQARMHEMAKLETLGQLTGGVAHDFNNLLTPIIGALDFLNRRTDKESRSARLISGALEAAERASVLVQRLLTFARRQHLETRTVDIGRLIEGMGDLIQRSIGSHVPVTMLIEDDLPAARIDPNQLELAVLNLCVNAKDAMAGGGSLTIKVGRRHLARDEESGLKAGDYIRLSVIDTGAGMDEATLARAIEPFYTTKGPGKGTGLGLSMVHGLAAQSGGALKLKSKPGHGLTAEIWLPASKNDADPMVETESGVPHQPRHAVILLVDDEDLVRRATADMLRDMGHEVVETSSPTTAIHLLRQRPDIEVLVSDYLMPGMRGTDLIRTATLQRPDLKSLLITGYAKPGDDEGIEGPRLSKPFRAADLGREIARLLSDGNIIDLSSARK